MSGWIEQACTPYIRISEMLLYLLETKIKFPQFVYVQIITFHTNMRWNAFRKHLILSVKKFQIATKTLRCYETMSTFLVFDAYICIYICVSICVYVYMCLGDSHEKLADRIACVKKVLYLNIIFLYSVCNEQTVYFYIESFVLYLFLWI